MKYFGLFTYGFGFLGSAFLIVWGVLLIVESGKALPIYRFFLGERKFSQHADQLRKVGRLPNAVLGICSIAFAILALQSLIRSLIHIYSR